MCGAPVHTEYRRKLQPAPRARGEILQANLKPHIPTYIGNEALVLHNRVTAMFDPTGLLQEAEFIFDN